MNKEAQFYVNVLSDFLNERKSETVSDVDWNLLREYAFMQNTNGIVFFQCKDFMPKEVFAGFNSLYMSEIYNYAQRISLTKAIQKAFEENKVTYCLVKGPVVAVHYPVPALRTMGDSDFVVKEECRENAYRVMDELGYELKVSLNERAYYKNGMEVEVHHSLVSDNYDNSKDVSFANRIWDYVKDNKLDDSYHFVFLLIHLKKHILVSGVGFRQFMDLAVEMKKADLDWDFIEKETAAMGLDKFMNVCLSLVYKWFGVSKDNKPLDISSDFLEETTMKLLKNGVHGFGEEDNTANSAFEVMNRDNNVNIFSKVRYMLQLYFPPFEYFRNDVNYEFLRKRPYLLPCAWIYRFYLSLKNNNAMTEIKRSLKGLFMSRKEIEKRKSDNDNWGF